MERATRQFMFVTIGFILALLVVNAVVTLLGAPLAGVLAMAA